VGAWFDHITSLGHAILLALCSALKMRDSELPVGP
jgi:hypothetical protein